MQTALSLSRTNNRLPVVDTSPSAAPPSRLAFIEGMRAIAALTVVWNHIFAEVFSPFRISLPPGMDWIGFGMVLGHLSVTTFIVLSGFCLMLPLAKTEEIGPLNIGEFFRRRALRILPPYYSALILGMALVYMLRNYPLGIYYDSVTDVRLQDVAAHFLLVHNIFGTGKINYVFWSIATEWQLYFLFPLLVALFRKQGVIRTTTVTVILGLVLYGLLKDTRLERMSIHYIGFFALGMMAARIALSTSERSAYLQNPVILRALMLLGWAMVLVPLALLGWRFQRGNFFIYDVCIAVATFATLIQSTRNSGPLRRFYSWKPLVTVGKFSYSVYLMHVPFIAVMLGLVLRPMGLGPITEFWILSTVGVGVILGCSYLFFWCFERPFLRAPDRVKSRAKYA